MNSISQIRQNTLSHFKERIYIICALLLISCLILIDILHEVYSGVKFEDLAETAFIEGSILATTFITVAYILRLFNKEKVLKESIQKDLISTQNEAEKWKNKSDYLVKSYREFIDKEFTKWKLSKSEQEVAALLLQGMSSKDIATRRSTSDRTIRNQCQVIYQKSNLKGKNELMAYFLKQVLS
jgi:DNA-binding NarL/FixJ family response regulator